ncbi:flavin-containing monooxygenase [Ottowia thiooxydans]|uniref:flavin-containing monooxygenase n=1 Tax=Ottowia thiooxydans TaxID=219182 RepID=UPI0012EB926E|nr:NAD(P)/FAD-dependent oxidoreductase [Ottowia thiooxydans]
MSEEKKIQEYDALVVGAGFAGLYLLHRLRALGMRVKVFEAGDDVGGTWYWNRYPGARCDVESLEYSFSFSEELQQEWKWSERYAGQGEILRYLQHVADRFNLRRDVMFDTRVASARFAPAKNEWTLKTEAGEEFRARFCIMATGNLSKASVPNIPGIESFQGRWFHTSAWPKDPVDFSGLRVGVVGTGSTGIQVIPRIAEQAQHLYVFQRTANYCIPLRNGPQDANVERESKGRYTALRKQARESPSGVAGFNVPTQSVLEVQPEERDAAFERRWNWGGIGLTRAFNDVLFNAKSNQITSEYVKRKMREVVKDPKVADALTPTYPIGTKRLCADTGYFQTFNRDNVTLVDIRRSPISAMGPSSVQTQDATYEVDALVFATGFDAMTGTLLAIDIGVEDGPTLKSLWADGPHAYLGLMVAGLPNLFMVTGPGSPSVLSNVVVSIEQHVEWITDCLGHMQALGLHCIEALPEAQEAWCEHVNEVAGRSLLAQASSWYTGANIPGKPRGFIPYMGGVGAFRAHCDEVARNNYQGFVLGTTHAISRTLAHKGE